MSPVAVLFARSDSYYKTLPGCDVYDRDRDARTYAGAAPIVAHPPCRSWGALRHMAKPRPGERRLAIWSVHQVRRHGGVLEHPRSSLLWEVMRLPAPGERDAWGGWTLPIHQLWWGHRCEKSTLLYIVGCEPRDVPPIPLYLGEATHVIASGRQGYRVRKGHPSWKPEVSKAEREHTPPALAEWLCELARRSRKPDA